jgi:recombination protein RecA
VRGTGAEQHRERTISRKLSSIPPAAAGAIPTGFPALDAALGAGLPRGAIVELFGPAACGKSTLALQMVAAVRQYGFTAAWVDAEHAFDPIYATSLGVELKEFPVLQPESAEEALEMARQLAGSGALDLLVVDSAAALVPSLELLCSVGETGATLHASVLASGLRRLHRAVANSRACVLFLNQTRSRSNSLGEARETSAGGAPLRLYAAVRIAVNPVASRRMRLQILKNRAGSAFGSCEVSF